MLQCSLVNSRVVFLTVCVALSHGLCLLCPHSKGITISLRGVCLQAVIELSNSLSCIVDSTSPGLLLRAVTLCPEFARAKEFDFLPRVLGARPGERRGLTGYLED